MVVELASVTYIFRDVYCILLFGMCIWTEYIAICRGCCVLDGRVAKWKRTCRKQKSAVALNLNYKKNYYFIRSKAVSLIFVQTFERLDLGATDNHLKALPDVCFAWMYNGPFDQIQKALLLCNGSWLRLLLWHVVLDLSTSLLLN